MITVDASVWVGFLDRDDPFYQDSEALLQRLQASAAPAFSPEFAVLEIACAVARRHRDAQAGALRRPCCAATRACGSSRPLA